MTSGFCGDLLLTNCVRFLTGETVPTRAAVLCHEDKIAAVAPSPDEALAAARRDRRRIAPGVAVVDLGGALLLPGLHDCHVHLAATGRDLLAANLRSCGALEDVWTALRLADQAGLHQGPLLVGNGLNELNLAERKMPTLTELDSLFQGQPVLISRVDGHSCIVNSAAWKSLDLPFCVDGPYPEGVELDSATGRPTGCFRAAANAAARRRLEALQTDTDRERAIISAAELAADAGCTTIHCLEGGGMGTLADAEVLLRLRSSLPVRTVVFAQTTDMGWAVERGLSQIGGCLLIDGSLGSHTAALREPYADRAETSGVLYFGDADLRHFLTEADRAGLQVALHTIGDAAIEQAISAWESISSEPRRGMRHRLEHFSLPSADQIRRAVSLGMTLSVQPSWARDDNPYPAQLACLRLGQERARRLYPLRTLLDAGAVVIAGSDSPVAALDPLAGIIGAIHHFQPGESVGLGEAIALSTANAARAAGPDLPARGRIRAGLAADLTIVRIPGEARSHTAEDSLTHVHHWQAIGTVMAGRLRLNAAGHTIGAASQSQV